jgi:hypothetical protein
MDALKAVLSGFIGIRSRTEAERASVNPLHVVILAVIGVALFIFAIRAIVRIVVS